MEAQFPGSKFDKIKLWFTKIFSHNVIEYNKL